ncbi:MAG: hypothetical protein Q4C04_03010 [Clostridia bacterium]|nr:hypothetical protein [Clostridia bacterium]
MEKKQRDVEHILEIVVVVMLGLTALLTAWATWIGSLHGGQQATNYTVSNNLASEGNSEYNAGVQSMMQDMLLWNEVSDLQLDIFSAQDAGDDVAVEQYCYKLYFKLNDNLTDEMAAAIGWEFDDGSADLTELVLDWLEKDEALVTPFADESFADHYFVTANELIAESEATLEQGKQDNQNGDAFGLVTVIYGVVLFLLGINSSMKSKKNKIALIIIALVGFAIATVYMLTIPMPTGFTLASFFGG